MTAPPSFPFVFVGLPSLATAVIQNHAGTARVFPVRSGREVAARYLHQRVPALLRRDPPPREARTATHHHNPPSDTLLTSVGSALERE